MSFNVTVTNLTELMLEKAAARDADIRSIQSGTLSAADINKKNAMFRGARRWTCVHMSDEEQHFSDEDDDDAEVLIVEQ